MLLVSCRSSGVVSGVVHFGAVVLVSSAHGHGVCPIHFVPSRRMYQPLPSHVGQPGVPLIGSGSGSGSGSKCTNGAGWLGLCW